MIGEKKRDFWCIPETIIILGWDGLWDVASKEKKSIIKRNISGKVRAKKD